jgi:hypothetical protein
LARPLASHTRPSLQPRPKRESHYAWSPQWVFFENGNRPLLLVQPSETCAPEKIHEKGKCPGGRCQMGQKCAGPLQLRVKSVLVQRPDQSRSSVSIQRSAGLHGRTKPTIQATVKTLIHYFPHARELRAVGMVMRSPAAGGLDGTPDARICDPAGPLAGSRVRRCCARSRRGDRRRRLQGPGGGEVPDGLGYAVPRARGGSMTVQGASGFKGTACKHVVSD